MNILKPITGEAAGFIFTLSEQNGNSQYMLRIEQKDCDEHFLCLDVKHDALVEFCEAFETLLQQIRGW